MGTIVIDKGDWNLMKMMNPFLFRSPRNKKELLLKNDIINV